MMITTELIGSILVDMGYLSLIVALALGRFYISPELDKVDVPFWQQIFPLGLITYWNAFPDFKHRFLLVFANILPLLGLVLIAYGGGWLNGHPLFWYEWL